MWAVLVATIALGWWVILGDTAPLVTDGDRLLLLGKGRAGTAAPKLLAFFGVMFVGPVVAAALGRVTPRVGLACGFGTAFFAVFGLATLAAVVGTLHAAPVFTGGQPVADALGVASMAAFVFIIAFGPPAFVFGAVGGALGARIGGAGRVQPLPDLAPPAPDAVIPVAGTLEALVHQTRLVQADLEHQRRPLSMRQKTMVFEWVQQLVDLAERTGAEPIELGLDRDGIMGALDDASGRAARRVAELVDASAATLARRAPGGYRQLPVLA